MAIKENNKTELLNFRKFILNSLRIQLEENTNSENSTLFGMFNARSFILSYDFTDPKKEGVEENYGSINDRIIDLILLNNKYSLLRRPVRSTIVFKSPGNLNQWILSFKELEWNEEVNKFVIFVIVKT
jgi:hypothetical protein